MSTSLRAGQIFKAVKGFRQAGDDAGRELHAWRRGFYRSQHPKCESRSQVKFPIPVKNQVGMSLNVARVDYRRALANDSFWALFGHAWPG
jgi:hypothetical protein